MFLKRPFRSIHARRVTVVRSGRRSDRRRRRRRSRPSIENWFRARTTTFIRVVRGNDQQYII